MTRYVVDAATLVHLVDAQVVVHEGHQLVAPSRVRSEALELLLHDVREGRRTEKEARDLHTRMTETKIRALGDRVSRWSAWRLAQEHGWADLRDAEYLAVTRLQADALVTVDPVLRRTAEGVVPLADVDALSTPRD